MMNPENIVRLVRSRRYSPMTSEELAARFSVAQEQRDEFAQMLSQLEIEGQVVRGKGRRWVDPKQANLVVGRLQCNPDGFGFIIPPGEGTDTYVAGENMKDAMHNDVVVAEREPKKRGRSRYRKSGTGPAGRVVKVLRRANHRLIGTFFPGPKFGRVKPDDPRILKDVYIPPGCEAGAAENEKVLVKITAWPSPMLHGNNAEGEVIQVMGKDGAPGVDVQTVIAEFNLPDEFPARALREAEEVPSIPDEEDTRNRRDLLRYTTVAIDPEDARDRDDALSLYSDPHTGNRVVLVHIADVSHYVRPDSALDEEARRRGQSVYLVSDFVPMLPRKLTQEVLSFVEGEDRLAKTVVLEFDDQAELVGSSVCHSVAKVDRAMTYTEVRGILDAAEDDPPSLKPRRASDEDETTMAKHSPEIRDLIIGLDRLAQQLRAGRRRIGSVDLDVPEYDVRVDADGQVTAVSQIERDRAHALVEEFMLSANRVVAGFLIQHELPGVYRIHEEPEPENLEDFAQFILAVLGKEIDPLDRRQLQELLAGVSGTALSEAVNMEFLRCMKRAVYATRPGSHFALHFDCYCHFTSPVRRYPDLVTHQILDQYFAGKLASEKVRARWKLELPGIAHSTTESEQRADQAEREIVKIKLLRFLEQHGAGLGEAFDAVITGVQEYGVFAQLQRYSVEGLIKVAEMKDDSYRFDEKSRTLTGRSSGRTFRLGQSIKVVIGNIDTTRRRMDLLLAKSL